jgi:hypothetical protein
MNDYFDELEAGLRNATRRRAHLPWYRRIGQMSLRQRRLAAVVAALVIATPTVAAVGAVAGWWAKGKSPIYYPASASSGLGKVLPQDGRLLPIRVADPDRGPPWGIRMVKTTRGETCIQVGRVVDGQIGQLGIDGAWNNDHKFHEIKPNDQMADMCGATDDGGHGFVNSANHGAVASVDVPLSNAVGAIGNSRCRDPYASVAIAPLAHHTRLPAKVKKRLEEIERERRGDVACPLGSMRMVFAGLLGPDAKSVTYKTPAGQTRTEQTVGGVGAYLIVFKETASNCHDFSQTLFDAAGATSCDNEGSGDTPDLEGPTAVTSVTYADGKSCNDQTSQSFAAAYREFTKRTHTLPGSRIRTLFARFLEEHHLTKWNWHEAAQPECKPIGWRAAKLTKLTSADVASPIPVKLLTGTRFCVKTSELGLNGFNDDVVCDRRVPAGDTSFYGGGRGIPSTLVKISFIARQAVTSDNSTYSVFTKAPGNNGGSGSGTQSNLRAGQRVRLSWFVGEHVSGVYHGTVVFVQNKGSNGLAGMPLAMRPGKDELVVGHFSFRYRHP